MPCVCTNCQTKILIVKNVRPTGPILTVRAPGRGDVIWWIGSEATGHRTAILRNRCRRSRGHSRASRSAMAGRTRLVPTVKRNGIDISTVPQLDAGLTSKFLQPCWYDQLPRLSLGDLKPTQRRDVTAGDPVMQQSDARLRAMGFGNALVGVGVLHPHQARGWTNKGLLRPY
jgi:hypothetical protein